MTQLSENINTTDLSNLIINSDKIKIADFVYDRFYERYILPIESLDRNDKNGFSIMAVSCLMIESLVSFKKGWEDTKNKSEKAFQEFLTKEPEFTDFKGLSKEFYINVRCGILHQSETTSGWKIKRKGILYDESTKTINATLFLNRLKKSLENYRQSLKTSEWDSSEWENLRNKIRMIIKNCE
jgi:hypothetical protein